MLIYEIAWQFDLEQWLKHSEWHNEKAQSRDNKANLY